MFMMIIKLGVLKIGSVLVADYGYVKSASR